MRLYSAWLYLSLKHFLCAPSHKVYGSVRPFSGSWLNFCVVWLWWSARGPRVLHTIADIFLHPHLMLQALLSWNAWNSSLVISYPIPHLPIRWCQNYTLTLKGTSQFYCMCCLISWCQIGGLIVLRTHFDLWLSITADWFKTRWTSSSLGNWPRILKHPILGQCIIILITLF